MPRIEVHVKRVMVAEGGAAPAAKSTGAKRQRALVYGGAGAGTRSGLSAVESLLAALPQNATVGCWLATLFLFLPSTTLEGQSRVDALLAAWLYLNTQV